MTIRSYYIETKVRVLYWLLRSEIYLASSCKPSPSLARKIHIMTDYTPLYYNIYLLARAVIADVYRLRDGINYARGVFPVCSGCCLFNRRRCCILLRPRVGFFFCLCRPRDEYRTWDSSDHRLWYNIYTL